MKHQVHLCRDDDIVLMDEVLTLARAQAKRDEFITRAHSGTLGIGRFDISIYEMGPEGHLERVAEKSEPFYVPARIKETA